MQRRFVSFRASDLHSSTLQDVCSSYFAYEHARTVRQALIRRMLLMLAGAATLTLGFHLLPIAALATIGALAAIGVALCFRSEWRARGRLLHELRDVSANDPRQTG
jgi:hypothetical protein